MYLPNRDEKELLAYLSLNVRKRYYVYRLVDPRTYETFYVGKGCGNRVFQHVNDVRNLIKNNKNEDEFSLKEQRIAEIITSGKNVISIIHRWGLSENEAFEVEAALIDAYPGLANVQKGHGFERGVTTVQDLINYLNLTPYSEPNEKYVIIKTSVNAMITKGLYDATRICWRASLKKARNYHYVFAVINGVVKEIYKVNNWFQYSQDRIAFEGEPANGLILNCKNKLVPQKYIKRGMSNPFLYKM